MNPIANYASILEIMFALFVMAFFSVSSFEVAGSCGNYPIHFKNIYPILGKSEGDLSEDISFGITRVSRCFYCSEILW